MPVYMDVHIVPGVKARDIAEAHFKNLLHEDEYGCKCMTYWIDEERENIFCLIEAPDKDSVELEILFNSQNKSTAANTTSIEANFLKVMVTR